MPLVRVRPVYPAEALERRLEGFVDLDFTITTTGTVKDIVVVGAEPPGVFEAAARLALSRNRYNPRVEDGVPVERPRVRTRITFELPER